MKEFTRDELSELLLDTFDFPQNEVDATIEQLLNMSETGKNALEFLVTTRELPDIEFQGLSIKDMKRQKPEYSDIALIIIYDGFVRGSSEIKQ